MLSRTLPLLALLLVLASVGCTKPKTILGGEHQDYTIVEVRFEGVSRFSQGKLLDYLYMGETSWVPLSPDYAFDEALVAVDARRVEALYRSVGYYEAEVTHVEADIDHEDQEVSLVMTVVEGEPTLIGDVARVWGESDLTPEETASVEAQIPLERDKPFEVAQLNNSLGNARMAMMQLGYPLAVVTNQAEVDVAKRRAAVEFRLEPGPKARIGAVRFEGLEGVPQYMVDREVEFALGELYSPARVQQIEASVRGMRVFRWVAARPPTEVKDGAVELVVQLSEADPQSLRAGLLIALETVRWQEQVRIDYTHTNLFGHLTRLDFKVLLGWAELPNPFTPDLHGPVVSLEPQFTKKGLLEKQLTWALTPKFDLDLEEGYQYYSPSNRFGVSRWFAGMTRLGFTHNLRMVDFFNVSPDLEANTSLLGRDYRDPFWLSYLELQAQAYLTDSITKPTNGAIFDATYSLSSTLMGSDFDFHKFEVRARAYWKVFSWLQIATRAQTGLISRFGDQPGTPFNFRFYLGGANSVRGWGSRKLAPRIEECDADGACDTIQVGGYTMVQANLELRFRLLEKLFLVTFADLGDVQEDELTWNPSQWNYTAGPGLRYDSPMGMVRLDAGFRLNDPGVYTGEPSWGLYFGLGESF